MTLRQKIECILLNSNKSLQDHYVRENVLDEIMDEISKEVYGKPMKE